MKEYYTPASSISSCLKEGGNTLLYRDVSVNYLIGVCEAIYDTWMNGTLEMPEILFQKLLKSQYAIV